MQRRNLLVCRAQVGRADAQATTSGLDVSLMLCAIVPQHNSQAGHALAADDADLDARLIRAVGDNGGKTRFHEIDLVDTLLAPLELLPHGKITDSR